MRRRSCALVLALLLIAAPAVALAPSEVETPRVSALSWFLDLLDVVFGADGAGPGADPNGLTTPPPPPGEDGAGPGADPNG